MTRENQTAEKGTVHDAAERDGSEVSESSGRENALKGMGHGPLREGDLENCEPDENSMELACPTEMGYNVKWVDEHSEENVVVIGEVTSGKMIEVEESMRGIGLFPRFFPILSRPITDWLSQRYDPRSVFTMCGRERRDVTIAPGGNERHKRLFRRI